VITREEKIQYAAFLFCVLGILVILAALAPTPPPY